MGLSNVMRRYNLDRDHDKSLILVWSIWLRRGTKLGLEKDFANDILRAKDVIGNVSLLDQLHC